MRFPRIAGLLVSALILALFLGCNGAGAGAGGGGSSTPSVRLHGTITDRSGTGIQGASIEVSGSTVTTESDGGFDVRVEFTAVPDRVTYNITKDGFFEFEGGVRPSPNGEAMIMIALSEKTLLGTVDASAGGNVNGDGMDITVPANAVVDQDGNPVSGDVNVFANSISPDDPDFSNAMPGGDFQAEDDSGDDGSLTSFGAMNLGLEDSAGNDVDLSLGVTVRLDIPASLQADAPATIDVWIMRNNRWEVLGQATRDGNVYVFLLEEEGAINWDIFGRNAIVEGTVYDFGAPVPNTEVTIGQMNTFTDASGEYSAFVPSNRELVFEADPYGSVTKSAGSLSTTEVNRVDIGAASAPELGEGTFTFQGTTYTGPATATSFSWGIVSLTGDFLGLTISGVPSSGTATVESGAITAGFTDSSAFVYVATSGSVTRSGNNLSFSFQMNENTVGGAAAGTLSGAMTVTEVTSF
jgi:hypothetical protein